MAKNRGLSDSQKEILAEAKFVLNYLSEEELAAFTDLEVDLPDVDDDKLLEFLELTNILYRAGEPLISDEQYDFSFLQELRTRNPDHPYLHTVEPEPLVEAKTVELPVRMLSTEKAYELKVIKRWA